MSTYIAKAKHPKTGKKQKAIFLDDFYGNRLYAVAFRKDGKDIKFSDKVNVKDYEIYPYDKVFKPN